MVKGVGYNLAQVILQSLNINPYHRVGFLTDKDISDIENAIKNIHSLGVPNWYLNRRKDMDTGSDVHLITSDLDFIKSNDIDREKSMMSWRGYRHMFGLRVRGQRTRNTGRRSTAVGVKKVAGKAPASSAGGSK